MNYDEALRASRKAGASRAKGLAYLAMVCQTLAQAHAISPSLTYEGAVKQGLSGDDVRKLNPIALCNLMFDCVKPH